MEKEYDEKCDIWSVGAILYLFLCGHPPFTGNGENEILKKVYEGQVKFDGKKNN